MKFIASIVLLLSVQLIFSKKLRSCSGPSNNSIRNAARVGFNQCSGALAYSENDGNNGSSEATSIAANVAYSGINQSR